jgi:type II secretory pathway pseudopilin PulG
MRKAYSLIEAVVAVSILSIVISVATSIIFISSDTENSNKTILIAEGLAVEGLEAMQNIYDTNILKYGEDNKLACAFVEPGQSGEDINVECADPYILYGLPGDKRYYYINRVYETETVSQMLTWDTSTDYSPDSIIDTPVLSPILDPISEKNYRLYTHELCAGSDCSMIYISGEFANEEDGDSPTKYYREILLENADPSIIVTSYVYWTDQTDKIRNVKKQLILSR